MESELTPISIRWFQELYKMRLSESASSMKVNLILGFLMGDKKAGLFNLEVELLRVKNNE